MMVDTHAHDVMNVGDRLIIATLLLLLLFSCGADSFSLSTPSSVGGGAGSSFGFYRALRLREMGQNRDNEEVESNGQMEESTDEGKNEERTRGYRPIEDWHAEDIAKNPEGKQRLAYLKREKARWAKTFDLPSSNSDEI